MNLAALVSGGKDSILALHRMQRTGHNIRYLLSMTPRTTESYMFHHPNTWMVELISQSLSIPLIREATEGLKEAELEDLRKLFHTVSSEVEGIVTGALASKYQKTRIDRICSELSLQSLSPLWAIDPFDLWKELLDNNYKVIVTAVAAEGLGEDWLGRLINHERLEELKGLSKKHRFHLGFEGGEAETLVLDMPLYKNQIIVDKALGHWDGSSGVYEIEKAHLEG